MALHFELKVNADTIGSFIAVRREVDLPPDRVCTYDVTVYLHGRGWAGPVRHNYDDGAIRLVHAGLIAAVYGGALPAGYHCASCDGHSCPDVG